MTRLFKIFRNFSTARVSTSLEPNIGEAKKALITIEKLWHAGKLREALRKIDEVERTYPSCSKAAKYHRGEIGVELLEKSGQLPPVLR